MVCLPIRGSPFRRGRGNTPFICRLFVLLLTGALFLFGSKAYADDQDGDASSTPSGESQASESTGNPGPPPKGAKEILRKEDAGGKMLASTVNPALRESFFSILLEEDVRRRPAGALDLFSDTPLVPQQYSLYRVRPRGNESSLLQYYEAYIMFQRDVFRLMTSEDLSALESLRARGRENFHNFYEQNIRRVRAESSEVNQLLRDVQGLENLRLSLGSEYAEGIAEGGALSAIEMAQLKASLESQALGRLSSDRRGNPDLALMLRDSVGRRLIQMEDSGGNAAPAETREKLSFAELQQRLASSIERVRSEHRLQRILATIPWIEQINREAKAEFESRGEVFSEISDGYVLMSDLAGKKTGSQSQRAYHPINQSLVSEFSIDDEGRLLVTDDTTGLITEVIGIENDLQMSSDKGVFAFQVEDYFRIRELRDTDFGWEVKPQEERGQLLLENFVYSEILAEMERLKEKIEKSQNLSEIRIAFNEFNQQVELMMSGESVGDSNDDITRKLQKKLMMALYPRASQQEGVLKDAEHYFSITSERYRHIDPWIEELRWARLGDTFTSGSWLHRDQQSRAVNNHSLSNVVDRYERWAQKRARQKNWRQEVVHKIANHPVRFAVWSAGITAALMFGGGAIHGHLSSASNRPPPLMGGVEEAAQNGLREEAKEKSLKFKTYNIPGATMLEIASLEELNQARNLSERLSGENGNFRVFGQEVFPVLGERMAIPMPPFMHLESLHLMNSDGLLYKQGIDYNVIYHEDKGLYGIHFLKPVSEVKISYTYNESLEANFDRSSQFRQVTENLNSERMKIVSNMMREAELTAIADDLEARMSRGSISLNDLRNSIKLNSGYSNALAPADILMSDHQLQNNPFLVFRPLIHEGRAFCECDPSNLINYLAKKLYYGEDGDVSVNMRGAFVVDGSEVRESHAYSEASLRSTGETHSFDSTAGGPVSEEEKQILEARDADARFWLRADISLERIDELAIRHLENGLGV